MTLVQVYVALWALNVAVMLTGGLVPVAMIKALSFVTFALAPFAISRMGELRDGGVIND